MEIFIQTLICLIAVLGIIFTTFSVSDRYFSKDFKKYNVNYRNCTKIIISLQYDDEITDIVEKIKECDKDNSFRIDIIKS